MKLIKKLLMASMAVFAASAVFADDWDSFGTEEEYVEPVVAVSGAAEIGGRVYTDQIREPELSDAKDAPTEAKYSGKLNFDYSGASTDASIKLKFNNNSLGEYKADILDEFTARAYLGNFQIEAGKMKTVWGKGDKLHVVDLFNANDYTDFVYPDYIDRRIGEPMFRLIYATPSNVKIEGIWTPMMTPDRLAGSGIWQPAKSKLLTEKVSGAAMNYISATTEQKINADKFAAEVEALSALGTSEANAALSALVTANAATLMGYGFKPGDMTTLSGAIKAWVSDMEGAYLKALSNSGSLSENLYPDTKSLKYGQAGIRTTFTLAGLDLGASYYYGHFKQPSVNAAKMQTYVVKTLCGDEVSEDDKFLAYDQLQVFGLEAAFAFWKFNMRAEGAYYLTEDTAGDNPWVQNNSIQWVAGFDMDMPWTNMNLNLQTQGKYIMNSDKIKNGEYADYSPAVWGMMRKAGASDVNYNSDDKYVSNKIVVAITDSYAHNSVKVELKGILEVETLDFVVMPALTVKAVDDFSVTASGMWIKADNENSEFYNFRRNSFAQISCKYLF